MKPALLVSRLFIVAVIVAIGVFAWLFWRERKIILAQPPTAWTDDHRADCAVVLTGGTGRVREGFDLLAQKAVKKLIISGVFPSSRLRDIFPQWPYYSTVNEQDVILEKYSLTTYGNAQQSLALVEALRCRDLVLITSTLHMPRSMRIFKAVFPHDIPIYARAVVGGSYEPRTLDLWAEVTKSLFYSIWAY